MITREQLLKNDTFWTETIQNKIFNDLATFVEKEGLSQKELARRLGVSKGRVSQIMKGDNMNFRIETLVKICLAIGKIPMFNLEDIEAFVLKDAKTQFISCVYNPQYSEMSEIGSSIKCDAKESPKSHYPLRIAHKSDLIDDYQNHGISEAIM